MRKVIELEKELGPYMCDKKCTVSICQRGLRGLFDVPKNTLRTKGCALVLSHTQLNKESFKAVDLISNEWDDTLYIEDETGAILKRTVSCSAAEMAMSFGFPFYFHVEYDNEV